MTFPTRGWLCSLQWHVLPIGDRFVYGTGAGRPWPRVETMCRGRSAGHVCGNVDYCHHTELADAPAGRQVKSRLVRLFRVRACGNRDGGEERCLAWLAWGLA